QRRDMADLERQNQERERQIRDAHEREARSIRGAGEQQMRAIQAQVQQSQQETERLRRELSEKNNSSSSEIAALMAQIQLEGQKQAEAREQQRQDYEAPSLEEKRIEADKEINVLRLQAEEAARQKEQERKEQRRREKDEQEARRQELEERKLEQARKQQELAEKVYDLETEIGIDRLVFQDQRKEKIAAAKSAGITEELEEAEANLIITVAEEVLHKFAKEAKEEDIPPEH
ncbi:14989_t:CDS:2, partial [Entrophospora sp. SA101]